MHFGWLPPRQKKEGMLYTTRVYSNPMNNYSKLFQETSSSIHKVHTIDDPLHYTALTYLLTVQMGTIAIALS